ncbi:MAG: LLM class flavin-dependent oxidoreductase [Deltaproteobacteria bacterium]|nr:LLM class flavin-dependent oxidoreductase [Deltaproteobacteria bacterium]MBW2413631.1 LLM class flavin-dependent oxidoreductase [Deltaproteobacteria bacterium]
MNLGVCVASHIGDIDYVVRAEALGYSHAWLADSQMIWSDCYATLALVADRTESIKIGTGVAITGTRPAPVTAASIATINALAPGRTFLGVGAGNTAMRIMGQPPHRIREFDRYLTTLRPLLRGDESMLDDRGAEVPIRHLMPDRGFVNFEDPIPMYVSGFGPRSLGLAGRHGDGAVLAMPPNAAVMEYFWKQIEAGAADAGRSLDRSAYYTSALTTIVVLDPGEAPDSPRARHECGAFAMATLHFAYDQWRQLGRTPPAFAADIWDDYCAMLAALPKERLHQRIHAGHNCWVIPEEERFVTRELIEASCLVGTAEQVVERLQSLDAAGLDQVMILPPFDPRYEVLERVARDVLPHV